MKMKEFEEYNLKKDQRVKIYCHYNGIEMIYCSGKIDKISRRKYKKYFEKLNEQEYYKVQVLLSEYDYTNDCEKADIDSYLISNIQYI